MEINQLEKAASAAAPNGIQRRYPKVFIVVLTWNRVDAVIACMLSMNALQYSNFEVIVVDNNSQDGTAERLREIFPDLTVIVNDRNLGYTGGNNVGIRHALEHGADYVLLLNNDSMPAPNLIDELIRIAESQPDVAVVGPRNMMYHTRSVLWAAYGEITYGPLLTRVHGWRVPDTRKFHGVCDVDHVIGCGYMWRREALEDIGLLDTSFFGYHEDVDWCFRAKKAGWRVVYVGTAVVYHQGSLSCNPSFGECMPVMYFLGRNGVLFARKHGTAWDLFRLTLNAIAGSLRRYRSNLKKGLPTGERQFWQGYLDGLHNKNRQENFR
jgi:GT2 family glycosyltransferase